MLNFDKYEFIIKYIIIFILYTNIIYIEYEYIKIDKRKSIEIDNELKPNVYEEEISYIYYKSKFKPIAFYHPEYNNISYYKYFKNKNKYNLLECKEIEELVIAQINLAKRHQIYGFGIYYNLLTKDYYQNLTLYIFLNKINFPFMIIWQNHRTKILSIKIIHKFINNIQKYLISDNYIKINNKPVISIGNQHILLNSNRKYNILLLRNILKKRIGDVFIIYPYTSYITKKKFYKEFDAAYDLSTIERYPDTKKISNILHYSGMIYKNLYLNELNTKYTLFRTCNLNTKEFDDYKPEKFFMLNNIIFNWKNLEKNNNEKFVFINSWNNYANDNYLEYDEKYGYASINTFSKSILNLPFKNDNYPLSTIDSIIIAVHVHVFYEDVFKKIIKKLQYIPLKYDLYISTVSEEKKTNIKKILRISNANKYEIKIYENKGRDVYPFIKQMKKHYKKYKYICHLHTKKSLHKKLLGSNWSIYLYNNLIGNREVISEILSDFQLNEKLGFIFPEVYYDIIKEVKNFTNINFPLHKNNKYYMNYILKSLFHNIYKIGENLVFPVGNMFWAKTRAIYQIFNEEFEYPEELGQTNETIMHAIERIWLYLVKLNGYLYKIIMKDY